jgi:hypothetical protein
LRHDLHLGHRVVVADLGDGARLDDALRIGQHLGGVDVGPGHVYLLPSEAKAQTSEPTDPRGVELAGEVAQ